MKRPYQLVAYKEPFFLTFEVLCKEEFAVELLRVSSTVDTNLQQLFPSRITVIHDWKEGKVAELVTVVDKAAAYVDEPFLLQFNY
ncbi:hypothetical protein RB195_009999 [Necator americanus]|uniref:Uncharacterized protein n=1 Tax=Necator americanus TaxID=51031 RepID=A0ABR1CWM2_NECAM